MCYDGDGLGSPLNAFFGKCPARDAKTETFYTQNVAALWEWQHQKGWLPFDAPLCNNLENAWASGETVCHVAVGGEQYNINFVYMWQQNCSTHTTRQIRRRGLKEASVWYWWSSDSFHRLGATVTFLVEAEYQKILTEGRHERHEVIWTVEDGTACTINVGAMQVTEETTGQSYPLTRSLIKADPSLAVAATTDMHCSTQQKQRDVVEPNIGKGPSGARASGEGRLYSTEQTAPDPQEPRVDSSLHLSVHGTNISLQVPQGGSVAVQVGAPQGQQQPLQQYHQVGQATGSNVFLTWGSTSCPCDRNGDVFYCCRMCRWSCCGCPVTAGCCCHSCASGSCPGFRSGSPRKHPCRGEGDATASKCLQCNLVQQNEDSVSVGTTAENVQVASTAPADENLVTPPVSPSPATSGNCGSPQQQEAQPQQAPQKTTTEGEQQRLLQQQTLELQQSQFLLRQEEQLTRQTHLEEQQEQLHHEQQQLVRKLQLQQDQLLENQRELHEQQRQLVLQHADQQQLFVQQAEELNQLREWAQKRETFEKHGDNGDHQTSCPALTPNTEANGEQAPLSSSGPPAHPGSSESRQTPTLEDFLSPVARTDDDEYTCI